MPDNNDGEAVRKEVGLPALVFTFTLDQIAAMLSVDEAKLKREYLYYAGRSVGRQVPGVMYAVNIAPDPRLPAEWRVTQREFVRFLKAKGFRGYDLTRGGFA